MAAVGYRLVHCIREFLPARQPEWPIEVGDVRRWTRGLEPAFMCAAPVRHDFSVTESPGAAYRRSIIRQVTKRSFL